MSEAIRSARAREDRQEAEETAEAVIKRFEEVPEGMKKTLTMDNGTENALHEAITAKTGVKCYFADPLCLMAERRQ